MEVKGSVALVTGANRGLGAAFVRELPAAGAHKVYAAARDPSQIVEPGAIPVQLDVTSQSQAEALALQLSDVSLVINNAGIGGAGEVLDPSSINLLKSQFETNVVGLLHISQVFAPVLACRNESAIINVISALSWATLP